MGEVLTKLNAYLAKTKLNEGEREDFQDLQAELEMLKRVNQTFTTNLGL